MNNEQHNEIGIGKRIKQARSKTNLSSIQVSKLLGLSHSICSQWERGNANPSTANLAKLSKILGVSFEWLALGEIENEIEKNDFDNLFKQLNPKSQKYLTKFVASVV
jgi:transcriptional regulator with XRE-family HTH domain